MKKCYCLTLDDNIRFLEEAYRRNERSLFDTAYLGMLRRLHGRFGCKVQLNMFFSDRPGSFSLADVPGRYRPELEESSQWLKLSFHARHNDPPFPYAAGGGALLADYLDVLQELARIAGPSALARTTTLHYAAATQKDCSLLRRFGVQGLIGMFYDSAGREGLHYYLPPAIWPALRRGEFYLDPQTDLFFAHNDLILNQIPCDEIPSHLARLNGEVMRCARAGFLQLMTHEQYFYPNYFAYQPDFEKKLCVALEYLRAENYVSVFLEECLPLANG